MATKMRPASAAAPPPTITKKLSQCSIISIYSVLDKKYLHPFINPNISLIKTAQKTSSGLKNMVGKLFFLLVPADCGNPGKGTLVTLLLFTQNAYNENLFTGLALFRHRLFICYLCPGF